MRSDHHPPIWVASIVGVVAVAVITVGMVAVPGDVPAEIPALLMLVVITAVSVLSGWRAGLPVAIAAGVLHALTFVEPRGVISLGYTQDVMTVLTFIAVAVVVSVLVSQRSLANRAELIGRERMLLLRSVSHDIRNPLNVILTASTELLDGADHERSTRDQLLRLIASETRRLNRIVDNLLNLSRLQAGALVPALEAVPVAELISVSQSRFDLVERRPGQITVSDALPDVDAYVDPIQMDQVLTNLIENAVRHGRGDVTVNVDVATNDRHVAFEITDDGPGFSRAARDQLFAPFHSTDGSSGLGLTVCKAIVEAHGGTITVTDRPLGGTSIIVRVPRG